MDLRDQLVELTRKVYQVDVSDQIKVNEDDYWVIFESSLNFDWYSEGVFIYQPEFEGEEGVKYVEVGTSSLYELDGQKEIDLWVRSDFNQLIKATYREYCGSDIESPHDATMTDFVVASCANFK